MYKNLYSSIFFKKVVLYRLLNNQLVLNKDKVLNLIKILNTRILQMDNFLKILNLLQLKSNSNLRLLNLKKNNFYEIYFRKICNNFLSKKLKRKCIILNLYSIKYFIREFINLRQLKDYPFFRKNVFNIDNFKSLILKSVMNIDLILNAGFSKKYLFIRKIFFIIGEILSSLNERDYLLMTGLTKYRTKSSNMNFIFNSNFSDKGYYIMLTSKLNFNLRNIIKLVYYFKMSYIVSNIKYDINLYNKKSFIIFILKISLMKIKVKDFNSFLFYETNMLFLYRLRRRLNNHLRRRFLTYNEQFFLFHFIINFISYDVYKYGK